MLAIANTVRFFLAARVFYDLSLALIVVGTVLRFLFRPAPVGFVRAMNIVAYVVAATAAVICFGYFVGFYMVWRGDNHNGSWTSLRDRVAGPATDLIHWIHPAFPKLPWAPYWWIFYAPIMADLGVGLLWFPVVRRRPALILCATAPTLIISRLLQLILTFSILIR